MPPVPANPPTASHQQRVVDYYLHSEKHYRWMWGLDEAMALHLGFWGRGARTHLQALADLNRELAARAEITPGDHVLDAGCGVGGSSIFLARELGCTAVGITLVERQCELARANAERLQVAGRVQFAVADFTSTGLTDGSFDVAWFVESACHAEHKARLIAEAFRVLRPGGRIAVADYFRVADPFPSVRDETLMLRFEDSWAVPRFECAQRFASTLQEAGFENVRCDDITSQVERSSRRLFYLGLLGFPVKALRQIGRPYSATKWKNLWSAWGQDRARRRGLWRYHLITARKP